MHMFSKTFCRGKLTVMLATWLAKAFANLIMYHVAGAEEPPRSACRCIHSVPKWAALYAESMAWVASFWSSLTALQRLCYELDLLINRGRLPLGVLGYQKLCCMLISQSRGRTVEVCKVYAAFDRQCTLCLRPLRTSSAFTRCVPWPKSKPAGIKVFSCLVFSTPVY